MLVPQTATAPYILYGRAGRLAINVQNHRILLVRIKVGRFDHPSVEQEFAGAYLEKFLRLKAQCLVLLLGLRIVGNQTDMLVSREGNHVNHRRSFGIAERMYGPFACRRHAVAMLARLVHRTETLHFSLAEELGFIQIALGKVVRRCDEVNHPFLDVHTHFADIVKVPLGNRNDFLSVAAHPIKMAITAAFALPSEVLVVLQPMDVVVGFQPGCIRIGKDVGRLGTAYLDGPHLVGILRTVHLLDKEFIASGDELHTRDIMFTGITGNVHPSSGATFYRYITYLDGRIGGTCLRIRETLDGRVECIYVVDDVEPARTFRIALPIGNVFAVGAPTETVTATELFFIHPVEGTVYNQVTAIGCQRSHFAVSQVFGIDVVL